jgi:hypothetical protein
MTFGSLPSITATQEFVVPKSIPIIFPIFIKFFIIHILCAGFIQRFVTNKSNCMPIGIFPKTVFFCQKKFFYEE